jgi:hypothetical protein
VELMEKCWVNWTSGALSVSGGYSNIFINKAMLVLSIILTLCGWYRFVWSTSMRRSYVVPMRWMVIYLYEVPGWALNLSSTKLPRPLSPWEFSPSRKIPHGRTWNRPWDRMISSMNLWSPDLESSLMHWMLKICQINSPARWILDITYNANVRASCPSSTHSRSYDDAVAIGLSTLSVGYDWQRNPIQNWTDTASCKENILGGLLWFSLI